MTAKNRGCVVNCPAVLFNEALRLRLREYGLALAQGATVCGFITYEAPVSFFAGSHVAFSALGAYSYVSFGSKLSHVSVGRYSSIAHQVEIGLGQHDLNAVSTSAALINAGAFDFYSGPVKRVALRLRLGLNMENEVRIGHDVWIGAHTLFPNSITVGTGAVVGSGAVVTKDVPPYAIVGGNPARVIRYRFSEETISDLINSQWWNFDLPKALAQGKHVPLDDAGEFVQWWKEWQQASDKLPLERIEDRFYVMQPLSESRCSLRRLQSSQGVDPLF